MSDTSITYIARRELPPRRESIGCQVSHLHAHGERRYTVSFGLDARGDVREVFCHPEKTGTDMDAILADACIGISHALQRGATITELAASFGQLRPEGPDVGQLYPPASPLGSILRAGAALERQRKRAVAQERDQ